MTDQPRSLFSLASDAPLADAAPAAEAVPNAEAAPRIAPRLVARALDVARGVPAAGVPVIFDRIDASGAPTPLGSATTGGDGRAVPPENEALAIGYYRVTFDVAAYHAAFNVDGSYPVMSILVRVADDRSDFEVPLLFSANGYSTYPA